MKSKEIDLCEMCDEFTHDPLTEIELTDGSMRVCAPCLLLLLKVKKYG